MKSPHPLPNNNPPLRYGCLDAVPPVDAATLFGAAARYGLAALRAECLRVLVQHTTVESVTTHVLLAAEQQCPELMQVQRRGGPEAVRLIVRLRSCYQCNPCNHNS